MSSKIKTSLKAIIKLSRQFLSQLDMQIENAENTDDAGKERVLTANTSKNTDQSQLTNEQLLDLLTERQSIITTLFEAHTQDQLSVQLSLINEVVLLDEEISSQSQRHKKALAEQVLKLRKSKKVRELYQKY